MVQKGLPGSPFFALFHGPEDFSVFLEDVVVPFFIHGLHPQPDHLLAHGVPEFPQNGISEDEEEHRMKRLVRGDEGEQASPGIVHHCRHGGHLPSRLPGETRGKEKLQGVPLQDPPGLEHLPEIRYGNRPDLDVPPGIHPEPPLLGEAVDRLPDGCPAHAELLCEVPFLKDELRRKLQRETSLLDSFIDS